MRWSFIWWCFFPVGILKRLTFWYLRLSFVRASFSTDLKAFIIINKFLKLISRSEINQRVWALCMISTRKHIYYFTFVYLNSQRSINVHAVTVIMFSDSTTHYLCYSLNFLYSNKILKNWFITLVLKDWEISVSHYPSYLICSKLLGATSSLDFSKDYAMKFFSNNF